jgi:hypothetical protein
MAQTAFISNASTYPNNLDQHNFWNYNLQDYQRRLDEKSGGLFGDEITAQVEVVQLKCHSQGALV